MLPEGHTWSVTQGYCDKTVEAIVMRLFVFKWIFSRWDGTVSLLLLQLTRSSTVSQTRLQGGFARQSRSDRRVKVSWTETMGAYQLSHVYTTICCSLWRPRAEEQFEEDSSCCRNVTENLVSYFQLFTILMFNFNIEDTLYKFLFTNYMVGTKRELQKHKYGYRTIAYNTNMESDRLSKTVIHVYRYIISLLVINVLWHSWHNGRASPAKRIRKSKFLQKYCSLDNIVCALCKHQADIELSSLRAYTLNYTNLYFCIVKFFFLLLFICCQYLVKKGVVWRHSEKAAKRHYRGALTGNETLWLTIDKQLSQQDVALCRSLLLSRASSDD